LAQWEQMMGLQFENIILNNLFVVYELLGLKTTDIVWAGPYIQTKNTKNKGGCQIDLLIHTRDQSIYVCEVKFQKSLGQEVIKEVRRKVEVLKRPRYTSIKTVLIYEGEASSALKEASYFDYIFDGDQLLNLQPN
jgi:hypothetical protein